MFNGRKIKEQRDIDLKEKAEEEKMKKGVKEKRGKERKRRELGAI